MDPFSVTVGIVSTLDVCTRTVTFLREVRKGASTVDQEIDGVRTDIEAIETAVAVLNNLYNTISTRDEGSQVLSSGPTGLAWKRLVGLLPRCEATIAKLQLLFSEILDVRLPKAAQKFESLVKSLRKHSRENEYLALKGELQSYVVTLQMLLAALQAYEDLC